jgi:hypothetical protein
MLIHGTTLSCNRSFQKIQDTGLLRREFCYHSVCTFRQFWISVFLHFNIKQNLPKMNLN